MIKLRKITDDEYATYLKAGIPNYAEEKMKGEGLSKEDAWKLAEDSYNQMLPKGPATENQFVFSVIETATGKVVGTMWFGKKMNGDKPYAFIYDVVLSPDVRGKGYGKEVMALTQEEVRKLGMNSIGLHVFGHNEVAISLYEKTGFRTTNRIMRKDFSV